MSVQEPQIFDMEPEGSPRMLAVILLLCGLFGVGIWVVSDNFTGDDQYYIESEWDEGTEPVNQRYDITPNLVRGKKIGDDSEEDEEAEEIVVKRTAGRKPTSGPVSPFLFRPTTPSTPTVPGTPATPTIPTLPTPSITPAPPK